VHDRLPAGTEVEPTRAPIVRKPRPIRDPSGGRSAATRAQQVRLYHQHGTTRMGNARTAQSSTAGARPTTSTNLFVVDGGAFPTGTGANPTLTMMANAWRVAEHIAERWPDPARTGV
jgi:choline dehydrogenase-like flavoprotein